MFGTDEVLVMRSVERVRRERKREGGMQMVRCSSAKVTDGYKENLFVVESDLDQPLPT